MQSRVCWWQKAFRISHFLMLVLDASACAIFFWLIEISDEAQGN
jgi:hypothetical protein